MVAHHRHTDLRWMAPHPMWFDGATGLNGAPGRPAILRFKGDSFMEEMMSLVETRPEALPAWLAVPETWRAPMPEPPRNELTPSEPLSRARARRVQLARRRGLVSGAAPKPTSQAEGDLKLFQPAQDRFYIIASQLVCARPGLPDHRIQPAQDERARFVVRRLVPTDGTTGEFDPDAKDASGNDLVEEYAFVPFGDTGGWWQRVAPSARTQLQPNEERLGLFPSSYRTDGRKRRLLLGALPIARREAYVGAAIGAPDGSPPPALDPASPDPRTLLWQTEVSAPWAALEEQAQNLRTALIEEFNAPPGMDPSPAELEASAREQLTQFQARAAHIGWLILIDARRFLQAHLPVVWASLQGLPTPRDLTSPEAFLRTALLNISPSGDLVDVLNTAFPPYDGQFASSFADGLLSMTDANAQAVETAETAFEWPDAAGAPTPDYPGFVWMPAHPDFEPLTSGLPSTWDRPTHLTPPVGIIQAIEALVAAALPDAPTAPVPDLRPPRPIARNEEMWFTVRCVFERPNCTGFAAPVVSAPSAPFQMASFFDPDAPTRDIRIPMPIDISPAGLRKFRKGAGFIVSDMFCGQFGRFKKTTLGDLVRSVLPWPLHKDLPGAQATPCKSGGNPFGLMISLSIPIVTICAFLLMMIMVALLDIVFRWMPFLFSVFRIELKKGAKD
ncbi:hypothetical protein [Sedimentitalea sp.]|uniref:hypothetical protein n=1 Tax=Sedimentitalea sp. TaxID=2048915 RepID=UPI00329A0042